MDNGTLVLEKIPCYDKEKGKDVLKMALLTDEMLLDSYRMATELQLEREFIALLLAEIHKRELNVEINQLVH